MRCASPQAEALSRTAEELAVANGQRARQEVAELQALNESLQLNVTARGDSGREAQRAAVLGPSIRMSTSY